MLQKSFQLSFLILQICFLLSSCASVKKGDGLPDLQRMIDITKSAMAPELFTAAMKEDNFCAEEPNKVPGFTLYDYLDCDNPALGETGVVVVHYLEDSGSVGTNVLTRNQAYREAFYQSMMDEGFKKTDPPDYDEPEQNNDWYRSEKYPGLLMSWQTVARAEDRVYHIGFLWDSQQVASYTYEQGVTLAHWLDYLITDDAYASSEWFSEKDVQWIADHGFDHITVYTSGRLMSDENGQIQKEKLIPLHSLLNWTKSRGLGLIVALTEFPDFATIAGVEEMDESQQLKQQLSFWKTLIGELKGEGDNLRYMPHAYARYMADNTAFYFEKMVPETYQLFRSIDPERHLYIANYSAAEVNKYRLPDNATKVTASFASSNLRIFGSQFMGGAYPEDFPRIGFPSQLPDLTRFLDADHPDITLSKRTMNQSLIEENFRPLANIVSQYPGVQMYLYNWGYFTGYPELSPETVEDKESIKNFAKAMTELFDQYNTGWSIYDYNSGMPVNVKGEPSILLKHLSIDKGKS